MDLSLKFSDLSLAEEREREKEREKNQLDGHTINMASPTRMSGKKEREKEEERERKERGEGEREREKGIEEEHWSDSNSSLSPLLSLPPHLFSLLTLVATQSPEILDISSKSGLMLSFFFIPILSSFEKKGGRRERGRQRVREREEEADVCGCVPDPLGRSIHLSFPLLTFLF